MATTMAGARRDGPRSISSAWLAIGGAAVAAAASSVVMLDGAAASETGPDLKKSLVGHYENRLREGSAPEKVFEYFASLQVDGEMAMTPEDFLRAITPFLGRESDQTGTQNFKYSWQAAASDPSEDAKAEYVAAVATAVHAGRSAEAMESGAAARAFAALPGIRARLGITDGVHYAALEAAGLGRGDFDRMVGEAVGQERARFVDLVDLDGDGKVSFGEYVFFTTLLSVPAHQLHLVVALMDADGDGKVSYREFDRVYRALVDRSPTGRAARTDGARQVPRGERHFGAGDGQHIDLNRLAAYAKSLREALTMFEFHHFANGGPALSAQQFARSLVAHVPANRMGEMLRRVETLSGIEGNVSVEEYAVFRELVDNVDELAAAIHLLDVASEQDGVDAAEFQRAAQAATGRKVPLSDVQVRVFFAMFDTDGSGTLDVAEVIAALQSSSAFGTTKRRDLGVIDFLSAVWECKYKLM